MLPGSFPEPMSIEVSSLSSSFLTSDATNTSLSDLTIKGNSRTRRSLDPQCKPPVSPTPVGRMSNSCRGSALFPLGSNRFGRSTRSITEPIPTHRRFESNPRSNSSISSKSSPHDPARNTPSKSSFHGASRPCDFARTPFGTPQDSGDASESTERHSLFVNMTPTDARFSHRNLREELLNPLTPKDTHGVIYVLCDPNRLGLGYKIGLTRRTGYEARIKQHKQECQFKPHVVYISDCKVEYCGRVEKLIHLDLKDLCQHWRCNAKHKDSEIHGEWFQVTEAFAVQTVKRWESFMRHEKPYGWDRQITPFWKHLLEKRWDGHSDVATFTDEVRRNQWTDIIAPPTFIDYLTYYGESLGATFNTTRTAIACTRRYWQVFSWQFIALLYSMFTLLLCPNIVAFSLFAVILGWTGAAVLSHVPLDCPKRRPKSPKKTP